MSGGATAAERAELDARRERVAARAPDLAKSPAPAVALKDTLGPTDWVVTVEPQRVYLAPATGWTDRMEDPPTFGPAPADDSFGAWLDRSTRTIVRSRNLIDLAGRADDQAASGETDVGLRFELLRRDPADGKYARTPADARPKAGDAFALRAENTGSHAVDVSIVFVDANYGIKSLYPPLETKLDNRLEGGGHVQLTGRATRTADGTRSRSR